MIAVRGKNEEKKTTKMKRRRRRKESETSREKCTNTLGKKNEVEAKERCKTIKITTTTVCISLPSIGTPSGLSHLESMIGH
jgi:hypothetical protein